MKWGMLSEQVKIAGVVKESITDGDGIRFCFVCSGVSASLLWLSIILRHMILTEEQL